MFSVSQQLLGFDLLGVDLSVIQHETNACRNVYEPPQYEIGRYDDVR